MDLGAPLVGSGSPSALCPAEGPLDAEAWRRASLRDRLRAWYLQTSRENAQFPLPVVVASCAAFGAIWWLGYSKLVMDHSEPLLSDTNIRSFVVYNVLHGLVGLGATSGLLGLRFKIAILGPLLHFCTPGALCAPLFPEVVRKFKPVPAVRTGHDVAAYVLLVGSLISALRAPAIGFRQLAPVYLLMAVNLVLDFSVLQALRLEMYGYMLICLGFPDWQHGCQVVQLGLWLWAAVSKTGPWWKYVLPFLAKDGVYTAVLPRASLSRFFWSDADRFHDVARPAVWLSYAGCFFEFVFPLLACAAPGSLPNLAGVGGMVCYHLCIVVSMAFASVQEWNYFTIIMNLYLFGVVGFAAPTSPLLLGFLVVVSGVVPLVGNAYPTAVPFLTAYRPYMGNWRFSWLIVKKSSLEKHRKLGKWADPIVRHDLGWFYSLLGKFGAQGFRAAPQLDHMFTSYLLGVPNFRPFVPMLEHLLEAKGWSDDDIVFAHSEGWQNQVFGWSLGTGYLIPRECTREAINHVCGFDEDEMFILNVEPTSLFPFLGTEAPFAYKVQCRLYDVTKGPTDAFLHGAVPVAELAAYPPTEMPLTGAFRSGNSIQGNLSSVGLDIYH